MKVLNVSLALFLGFSSLNSAESLESYISENKKQQFEYDLKKNEAESSKLRDSWISPLNLSYRYSKTKSDLKEQISKSVAITMDQPIFASGGIYYGIKYAQASLKYADFSVEVAKRKLIKDALSLLMQIKQIDLKIEKQKLSIENAEINLEIKKEQYLNGQLDSGFLDSAIIERNSVISALYDLETAKEALISSFKAISDVDHKAAYIPTFKTIDKVEFLNNNIVLKMSKSEMEKNGYSKDVTTAKYLPKVNFTAGYNWNMSPPIAYAYINNDSYNYGLRASMPIDINTFRDIESSKVSYLKSKVVLDDKKRVLETTYDKVMQNISNIDKKTKLSISNKDIYKKLLEDTTKLYEVGYKTVYDVDLLKNSLGIQDLDAKILKLDKQLELLTLYETYKKPEE